MGTGRGCPEEEDQAHPEVPACRGRGNSSGHYGQEEPEAWGEEGSERAGSACCQGRKEDHHKEGSCHQGTEGCQGLPEGYQECQVFRPQGWRKEIKHHFRSSNDREDFSCLSLLCWNRVGPLFICAAKILKAYILLLNKSLD